MTWSEAVIGSALARSTFRGELVVVPNCTWTGHECDLLVVSKRLMLVDVEVKISRADLKADAAKDKWWHRDIWRYGQPEPARVHRDWPPKVWKHYYAMPREIWRPELLECLASPASGVLVLTAARTASIPPSVEVIRRAQPCRDAQPIGAQSVAGIARLASLRMWDALNPPHPPRIRPHRAGRKYDMNNDYQLMERPPAEPVERCPCCGSGARVWQYIDKPGADVERVVMCDQQGDIGPRESAVYEGCLLQMPPNDFYRSTGREAVRYWNEYSKALNAARRKNNWAVAKVMRVEDGAAP